MNKYLILFFKLLLGGLVSGLLIFGIISFCNYIGTRYGEENGFLSFILISIIIILTLYLIKRNKLKDL
jgi:hypothetical protein